MVSSTILYHLQRTTNLCLYQIGKKKIPPSLFFPKAYTVTLIHCTPEGISGILQPSIFPNLRSVHYLSAHPGQVDLYTRFKSPINWLFPNQRYTFYQCMVNAGRGRVENRLIRTYVNECEPRGNTVQITLNLPGYGMVEGSWYHRQLEDYFAQKKLHTCLVQPGQVPYEYAYLYTPNPDLFDEPDPYFECGSRDGSPVSMLQNIIEDNFINQLMKDKK